MSATHAAQRKTAPKVKAAAPKGASIFGVAPSIDPLMPKAEACACGGGCPRCRKNHPLQAKLEVSQPGDSLEQEADQVADRVMRMPEGSSAARSERSTLARSTGGGGHALDADTRAFMERRFGHEFGDVRIHSDLNAARSARSLQAHAYTLGSNIVFGREQYRPYSESGRRLLAHELAHVVQQRSAGRRRIMRTRWTTSEGAQPSGDYLLSGVDPLGTIDLAPVPGTTSRCVFTPLFHVPEDRLRSDQRLTIRATAWRPDGQARAAPGPDWSINVFEYFDPPGSTLQYGCESSRDVNDARGDLADALVVAYPQHGGWSSRNLFVRVRNGSPDEILVKLAFEYPQEPQPSPSDQMLDGIQMIVQMLGLTEPLGFVFDGLDAIISATRRRWTDAGISFAAMIPFGLGQASTLLRWERRVSQTAEEVIGVRIPQRLLREMPADEIQRLIRESAEFLARARPPRPEPLQRALGRRGGPVDPDLLVLALHTRVNLAGVAADQLRGINVAVARVRVGGRTELIATRSVEGALHSEDFVFREVRRLQDANPGETVIVEQVFSERHPCSRSTSAHCLTNLRNLEREQISLHGAEGQMDVFYGIPEEDRRRIRDLRRLYGL